MDKAIDILNKALNDVKSNQAVYKQSITSLETQQKELQNKLDDGTIYIGKLELAIAAIKELNVKEARRAEELNVKATNTLAK